MLVRTLLLAALATFAVGAARAADAGVLKIDVATTPAGGNYAPRNVVAVWIEDAAGTFVKTIDRWADTRRQHLVAWRTAAGANDADAISGATRMDHALPLRILWDTRNRAGEIVPDGTYRIRMEVADRNATAATQNNQGTFTFVKGPTGSMQTTSNGGFTNVSILYDVSAVCDNSVVDTGETCDPPSSCPTSCPRSADACAPNVLTGFASSCTAACVVRTISECVGGDGCCPGSCTAANDSDCGGDGGGLDNDVSGGCAIGGAGEGAGAMLLLLGLGLIVSRRRRGA
jgi:MYXO-CTERM domain-containing protein